MDLVEADFTPTFLNSNLWSDTYNVEIRSIDPAEVPLANGSRTLIIRLEQQMHIFNANLQKQSLLEFDQISRIKSKEFSKFVADKKALITITFMQ